MHTTVIRVTRFRIVITLFLLLGLASLPVFALTPEEIKLASEIDAAVKAYVELGQFWGNVLVAKDGRILYRGSFGEANRDFHVAMKPGVKFNIGSIGKTFTAVSILQLAEEGKLKLTDPVKKHLPDFPHPDAITIHHLLTHTSGLFNYMAHPEYREKMYSLRTIQDFMPLIYDQLLRFETPGSRFSYSNSGMLLLGAVIEKVSGMDYPEYLERKIFHPAGMKDTGINFLDRVVENRAVGYIKSPTGKVSINLFSVPPASADGGIETTAADMLKFDRALTADRLMTAESKEKMFTPYKNNYACGWRVGRIIGHQFVGHGGGAPGVSAMFQRYTDDGFTVIVLSNLDRAAPPVAKTIEAILFGLKWERPRPLVEEVLLKAMEDGGSAAVSEHGEGLLREKGYTVDHSQVLNMLGYTLLGEKLIDEAIAVFTLNTRLFPKEANPFDSLAEACMVKGDLVQSEKHYQKALEIDPTFENARTMLKRLEELKMESK